MTVLHPSLAGLNPAQREAAAHVDGPLLVLAGPGSGKTTVITRRLQHLVQVQGLQPDQLLVLTFTRAAADHMKARAAQTLGAAAAKRVTFGTFHSLCYRLLSAANGEAPKVLDDGQQLGLLRQLLRSSSLPNDDETVLALQADLSRLASDPDTPFTPASMKLPDFQRMVAGYQQAKAERGVLDFDDLVHLTLQRLESDSRLLASCRNRWTHLMVDEFQDTNPPQHKLVQLLTAPRNNLCVVGDDDQSIYGWRGATPRFLLEFQQIYAGSHVVKLQVNYRAGSPLVSLANKVIRHNTTRTNKTMRAADGEQSSSQPVVAPGVPYALTEGPVALIAPADPFVEAVQAVALLQAEMAAGTPADEIAVIYRTNDQAVALAGALERVQIPHRVLGGLPNLYRRWPVQDVLAYLRLALEPKNRDALVQVINRPTRYISRDLLTRAMALCERTNLDPLTAIAQVGMLKPWQFRPLEELRDHLDRLRDLPALDAIGYVRSVIGYDDYLREYADKQKVDPGEFLTLLSQMQAAAPSADVPRYLEYVSRLSGQKREEGADGGVTLVTCHRAKGLEFDVVLVAGCADGVLPHKSAEDTEEERRLFYVAATRARHRLYLSYPRSWEGRDNKPSPFLAEALGKGALERALDQGAIAGRAAGGSGPSAARHSESPFAAPADAARRGRTAVAPAVFEAVGQPPTAPTELKSGTAVYHLRYGEGMVESVDEIGQRVTVSFGVTRVSLDLRWCLSSPSFFRILPQARTEGVSQPGS